LARADHGRQLAAALETLETFSKSTDSTNGPPLAVVLCIHNPPIPQFRIPDPDKEPQP
jgi:hypothetical protein